MNDEASELHDTESTSLLSEDDWEEEEEDQKHMHASFACIGCICLLILLMIGVIATVYFYVFADGAPEEVSVDNEMYRDYEGQICGIDEVVRDRPFLFYCMVPGSYIALSMDTPICVVKCPSNDTSVMNCPAATPGAVGSIPVPAYNTEIYAARICLPSSPVLKGQVLSQIDEERKNPTR